MRDWDVKYTCGSCKRYDYKGAYTKSFCHYYRAHYYPEDTCEHWEEASDYSSGGCFITTACCERRGLADDCELMTKLRALRDEYLLKGPEGRAMVAEYYRTAPDVIAAVNALPDAEAVYGRVYGVLLEVVGLIDAGKNAEAVSLYRGMAEDLRALTEADGG